MRLLVVEDDGALAEPVVEALREAGWAVDLTGDGQDALLLAGRGTYDVVVLGRVLAGTDASSVLHRLRTAGVASAVMILTARDTVADRVAGLDAGADDCLVEPFEVEELVARARALLRRRYRIAAGVIDVADLRIDLHARRAWRGGEDLQLSAREFTVLEYLALRREEVVTREELFERVYDLHTEPLSNVLDVHVNNLRRKIHRGHRTSLLHSVRGRGYLLGSRGG